MRLKKYNTNIKSKVKNDEPTPSRVACDEKKCRGEMMIWQPEVNHPELSLKRASCGICGWKGWV